MKHKFVLKTNDKMEKHYEQYLKNTELLNIENRKKQLERDKEIDKWKELRMREKEDQEEVERIERMEQEEEKEKQDRKLYVDDSDDEESDPEIKAEIANLEKEELANKLKIREMKDKIRLDGKYNDKMREVRREEEDKKKLEKIYEEILALRKAKKGQKNKSYIRTQGLLY